MEQTPCAASIFTCISSSSDTPLEIFSFIDLSRTIVVDLMGSRIMSVVFDGIGEREVKYSLSCCSKIIGAIKV